MERSVKERVVGATILVVLLVLIVPELLSGPKSPAPAKAPALPASESTESMRNVTVDLTTRRATAADVDGAAANGAAANGSAAGATDTEPASAVSASPEPGSPPGPTPGPSSSAPTITTLKAQQPSEAPPVENEVSSPRSNPVAKTVAPHEAAHGGWAVQLGSFASRVNADNLVRQLKGHETPAYVLSSGKGRDQRYRVRVGPLADRAAAERVRSKLAKDGHAGSLVAP